ncbi:SGNH hydrolase domain-containing protein [Streptomyces sp. S.PB5]|uniref:DUF459 domain-containing protein n=1 Tax=Streptomyces sp. S.PB5 TaxID=3020844 RepID=UPI0025B22A36|nr:SGNH hydrolase domain-containing protein [Streptomyces sp. S.PB5]MDN3026042.1 SGNH hydrolase domain-containing protein [Streptomyces sp. S.PB5]
MGDAHLSPAVKGKTVLVVGDSWAANFGTGMSKIASADNMIVNAGLGGCGIMMPHSVAGKKATPACLEWPEKWPQYMAMYKPDAVLLRTATWDMYPQAFSESDAELTIEYPAVRARFEKYMDRAIRILTENNTPVYLTNAKIGGVNSSNSQSLAMNKAVREFAEKNAGRGVHLLDLAAQLCNNAGCPPVAASQKVYDKTDHPTPWSRDRLAAWILNSMFADESASGV